MAEKLFPEILDKGSKGPAVAALQLVLKAGGWDPHHQIVVDGEYGDMTKLAVRCLQNACGIEAFGNFGPKTRKALLDKTGLDVSSIRASAFIGETTAVSP